MLQEIRRAVRERRYRFRDHAIDELRKDGLTVDDALNALLTGALTAIFDNDDLQRGQRYEVIGADLAGYELGVLCRFTTRGDLLLIITAYADIY
jgi:hypothetical protein